MIQIDGHASKSIVVSDPYVLGYTDLMLDGVVGQCSVSLNLT